VGNQDLLQRLNRQEVASEQETCKKPPRNRQRHPFRGGGSLLFELSGEEFAKRRNFKRIVEHLSEGVPAQRHEKCQQKRQEKRPARSHNPDKRGRKDSRRRDENKIAENALTTNRTRLKVRASHHQRVLSLVSGPSQNCAGRKRNLKVVNAF
jgi:hypothetical protein